MKLPVKISIETKGTPDHKIEFSIDAPGVNKRDIITLLNMSEKFLLEEELDKMGTKYPTLEMD